MSRTDEDRRQWIANDAGLDKWCREWMESNDGDERAFIRENREGIDAVIDPILAGDKPAGYLAYDHSSGCMCFRCQRDRIL